MTSLRLLTLNIWGAPYAQHRRERFSRIAQEIVRLAPDVVALQEAYIGHERRIIMDAVAEAFPYQRYFPSGLLGSGLLTLSRYPVIEASFERFDFGGNPEDLPHGDFYAGKGISHCRIDAAGTLIDLFNCHPHAQYSGPLRANDAVFTHLNLRQAADFIASHRDSHPIFLLGDLNTRPSDIGYRIITDTTGLRDAFDRAQQPTAHLPDATPHADDNSMTGAADDGRWYTFSAINPYSNSEPDQTLDYILFQSGMETIVTVQQVSLVMNRLLDQGEALAYSDHLGLMATFELKASADSDTPWPDDTPSTLYATDTALARDIDTLTEHIRRRRTRYGNLIALPLLLPDVYLMTRLLQQIAPRTAHRLRRILLVMLPLLAVLMRWYSDVILVRRIERLNSARASLTEVTHAASFTPHEQT